MHCPLCGRGLSAKYRTTPHVRRMSRRVSRYIGRADHALRNIPCPYLPAEG